MFLASGDDGNTVTEPLHGKDVVGEGISVPGSVGSRTVSIPLNAYLGETQGRGSSITEELSILLHLGFHGQMLHLKKSPNNFFFFFFFLNNLQYLVVKQ